MNDNEEWKVIEHFSNYKVSNTGTIIRVIKEHYNNRIYIKHKVIKATPRKDRKNTIVRIMNDEGVYCVKDVMFLVAKAFIPNPDKRTIVKPIDGNYRNLNVNNIAWYKKDIIKKDIPKVKKFSDKQVIASHPDILSNLTFDNIEHAAKHINSIPFAIKNAIEKGFKHKGYDWKYKD